MATLTIPYINQEHNVAPNFNGKSACGPTSAVMVLAAYGLIDQRADSYSHYGWYISNPYTNHKGVAFTHTEPDGNNNPAAGAFGACLRNDLTQGMLLATYITQHGVGATSINPDQNRVIKELQEGKPVIVGGTVQGWGHVTVLKGLTDNGHFVVNDPFWGDDKIYSWADVSPVYWMGVFDKPLTAPPAPTPTPPPAPDPNQPDDMSGINFHAGDFGPGQTQGAGIWVRARPSVESAHILTIAAKGTAIMFDGYAEDLEGASFQGGTRWYHIKAGQTDSTGQMLHGWIHSKMIDPK